MKKLSVGIRGRGRFRRLAFALAAPLAMLSAHATAAAPLTIMTQNMDEGTDYAALVAATTPAQFVAAVTQTYQGIDGDPTGRSGRCDGP